MNLRSKYLVRMGMPTSKLTYAVLVGATYAAAEQARAAIFEELPDRTGYRSR